MFSSRFCMTCQTMIKPTTTVLKDAFVLCEFAFITCCWNPTVNIPPPAKRRCSTSTGSALTAAVSAIPPPPPPRSAPSLQDLDVNQRQLVSSPGRIVASSLLPVFDASVANGSAQDQELDHQLEASYESDSHPISEFNPVATIHG
ncbi:hypothetical protein Y032_0135g1898 [Ancylostoma ceylanicum]|uniref:Uncharacterized protein n=1 Tax=Ancylostoma ceylanicum TaxID=53326 RepID=A0A016T5E6_9BILA|nr:hypothetical protein Y032_0135g1898 [Ancylostoma ceylanicum]